MIEDNRALKCSAHLIGDVQKSNGYIECGFKNIELHNQFGETSTL